MNNEIDEIRAAAALLRKNGWTVIPPGIPFSHEESLAKQILDPAYWNSRNPAKTRREIEERSLVPKLK